MITIELELIKNIIIDIKNDEEWVTDSAGNKHLCSKYTGAEYRGICDGLDRLVRHIEEINEVSNRIN